MPVYKFTDDQSGTTLELESEQMPDSNTVEQAFAPYRTPKPDASLDADQALENQVSLLRPPKTSALGAFGRSAARNVTPTAAFMAAAPIGAAYGAGIAAAIPVVGETGIAEVVGGLLGAMTTGTIAAFGAHKAQSAIVDAVAPESFLGTKSEEEDATQHPIASEFGTLATVGKPNPLNIVRAAKTLTSDTGRAALADMAKASATKDGLKAWQKAVEPATQKEIHNVLNVAQAGGINAAFNIYDQVSTGNYSFTDLTKAAAEGTLFNSPWIHARNPKTQAFEKSAGIESEANPDLKPAGQVGIAAPESMFAEARAAQDKVTAAVSSPDKPSIAGIDARMAGAADRLPQYGYVYDEKADVFHPVKIQTKAPNALEIQTGVEVPKLEVRTPVGQETPLRQPNEIAPTPSAPEVANVEPAKTVDAVTPPLPTPRPGERMVTVQRPDGSTYPAAFADKIYGGMGPGGTDMIAIATPVEGSWSHGMLPPGDKIIADPNKPTASEQPTAPSQPVASAPAVEQGPFQKRFEGKNQYLQIAREESEKADKAIASGDPDAIRIRSKNASHANEFAVKKLRGERAIAQNIPAAMPELPEIDAIIAQHEAEAKRFSAPAKPVEPTVKESLPVQKEQIAAFKKYLNELPTGENQNPKHKNKRFHQISRPYGDYLYAQDREKFMVDLQQWLKDNEGGQVKPVEPLKPVAPSGEQKYRVGNNPTLHTLVEKLPQSASEKANGEQPVRVKNDKTGDMQTVMETDLTPVKESAVKRKPSNAAGTLKRLGYSDTQISALTLKEVKALAKRKEPVKTNIGGENEKRSPKGDNIPPQVEGGNPPEQTRVAKGLGTSGKVLRLPARELAAEFARAGGDAVADRVQPGGGENRKQGAESKQDALQRGALRPDEAKGGSPAVPKARIFIQTDAEGAAARGQGAADFLASRLEGERADSVGHAANDFISTLYSKLLGTRVFIIDMGEGWGLSDFMPENDVIRFNLRELSKYDVDSPSSRAALEAVTSEELLHVAADRVSGKAKIESVWGSLSPEERQAVIKAYGKTSQPLSAYSAGHEYIRMVLQDILTGETTEKHFPEWRKNATVMETLRGLVAKLKEWFGAKPSNNIARQVIERIESAIRGEAPIGRSVFDSSGEPIRSNISEPSGDESKKESAGSLDQGAITVVMGSEKEIGSRPGITPESIQSSIDYAKKTLDAAGIHAELELVDDPRFPDANGNPTKRRLWKFDTSFDLNAEVKNKLIPLLEEDLQRHQLGQQAGDLNANLIRSIQWNLNDGNLADALTLDNRRKLDQLTTSETSRRGLELGALSAHSVPIQNVLHDPELHLSRTLYEMFGGKHLDSFVKRILVEFGHVLTDSELAQVIKDHPKQEYLINQILYNNFKDHGGRVYRMVQSMLAPKSRPKLSVLEANTRVKEAAADLIEQAISEDIVPSEKIDKNLSPLQQLLMLIRPENAEKVNALMVEAVKQGELEAGKRVAIDTAGSADMAEELKARFSAGEEPTREQIEKGLDLPQFSHWRVIRDNLTDYNPVSEKLGSKIVPSITTLAKQIAETPSYLQPEMKAAFLNRLTTELRLPAEEAERVWNALHETFDKKFAEGRAKAFEKAKESLTPDEEQAIPRKDDRLWQRIQKWFNAGGDSVSGLLSEIAANKGHKPLTPKMVDDMRALVDRIQRLQTLDAKERAEIENNPNLTPEQKTAQLAAATKRKVANNLIPISQKQRELGVMWSRWIKPIVFPGVTAESWQQWKANRGNLVDATMDYVTHNILFKIGFEAFRLPINMFGQHSWFLPTRLMAQIHGEIEAAKKKDLKTIWNISSGAMVNGWRGTTTAIYPALLAFKSGMKGLPRLDKADNDRLLNSINAMDRIQAKAREYHQNGEHVKAVLTYMLGIPHQVGNFIAAADAAQQAFVEYPEMLADITSELRKQGKDQGFIDSSAKEIARMISYKTVEAQTEAQRMFDAAGIEPGKKLNGQTLNELAAVIAKHMGYEYMERMGLPVDDLEAKNILLRRAQAWKEPVTHGPGALISQSMRFVREGAKKFGIPVPSMALPNAIAAGINQQLFYTPLYWLSDIQIGHGTGQRSPFFATPKDRRQRMYMAIVGTAVGGVLFGLMNQRDKDGRQMVVARLWPKDKKEAQDWAAHGHKSMTLEFNNPDGTFTAYSLTTGPLSALAPYAFGAQAWADLTQRQAQAQKKMNEEAAKKGLTPGTVEGPSATDYAAVAASAALGTLMGNRTFGGLVSSGTQYGVPNVTKLVAANLSSLVPGLPAYQEITRMMGVAIDPKLASIADFMVPTPSSGARMLNVLGDPVKTPDDIQRVLQIMTGGTYPLAIDPKEYASQPAYAALFATDFRPPSVNPARGYSINGQFRPMTSSELQAYTESRGQNLKSALAGLGNNPTIEQVKSAYKQANAAALQGVGVQSGSPTGSKQPHAASRRAVGRVSRARAPKLRRVRLNRLGSRRRSFSTMRHTRSLLRG